MINCLKGRGHLESALFFFFDFFLKSGFLRAQKELRAHILVGCSSWYLFCKFNIDFEKSHVDFVVLVLWDGVDFLLLEIS